MGGRGDWPAAAAAAWLSNNFTAISATGWVARMARVASHKLCSHGCLRWGLHCSDKIILGAQVEAKKVAIIPRYN